MQKKINQTEEMHLDLGMKKQKFCDSLTDLIELVRKKLISLFTAYQP